MPDSTYLYLVLVLPAFIISLIAQAMVKSQYRKYSRVASRSGYTGASAAQALLYAHGITDVSIVQGRGTLSDHFNPRTNTISLSQGVFNSNSIAAIGIACHEAGHAVQHATGYMPIKVRNAFVPVCTFASYAGIPLALIGYWLDLDSLVYIGLGLYSAILLFQLLTLPVELNASSRAIEIIENKGMLREDELVGAKKVLRAAAMTYVASLLVTLANLLRFISLFTGRRRR